MTIIEFGSNIITKVIARKTEENVDKVKILEKYRNEDDRLLISKLFDKIALAEKQNKIQVTDFLSPVELRIIKDVLNMIDYKNYKVYGAVEEADRNAVIIYPDKLEKLFLDDKFDYNSVFSCIRISNCIENYEHKMYLGACIKLGVKREKIGDIVVFENGADIIISKDIEKFLATNLSELNRFKNSQIESIKLNQITKKEQRFKEMKVIVSSLRLDNVVAEIVNTSRSKAVELLKQERVFINYKNEYKPTKLVNEKDLITVRGKGKFIIDEIEGSTRSGKVIILVKKYC